MTAQSAALSGGWTGFRAVSGDGAAANTAATDLVNILDTIEVPIVVLRRDLLIAGFNEAAADVLRLSLSGIGRAFRDISVLGGLPGLEQQCSRVIASGVESRADFRDGDKWFVMRISRYPHGERQVTGAVLTFANVTAFHECIDQVLYERECAKAILNTVADPVAVFSADQRIHSGNRAFYTLSWNLPRCVRSSKR